MPALNEERTVGRVIRSIPRRSEHYDDVKVIVVDDGSTDRTTQVSLEAGADAVVQHRSKMGVGAAVKSGIRKALEFDPDIICTLDADGQFDPRQITNICEPIVKGQTDVVVGTRFHKNSSPRGVPVTNTIANKIVALLISILISKRLTDAECGFRALRFEAARDLHLMGYFSFTHEMIIDLVLKGYRVDEVPVEVMYFKGRTSRAVRSLPLYGVGALAGITMKAIATLGERRKHNWRTKR